MLGSDATIIIPGYGQASLLDECLVAIVSTSAPGGVIVWDNGIEHRSFLDGDVEPEARLVDQVLARNPLTAATQEGVFNLGFAGGCNRAAAAAETPLVVFLNCDTIPQPGWLATLAAAFDDPEVGIAGARLVRHDGTIHHAGVLTNTDGPAWGWEIDEDLPTRDVDGVTGACLAVRRDLFAALGGFDEEFWNCFEDVDLCLRAREAGHRIRYLRDAVVVHHASATGSERWSRGYQNIVRFTNRWSDRHVPSPVPVEERERLVMKLANKKGALRSPVTS